MKKVLLSFIFLFTFFCLISCSNEKVEFTHKGILTYYIDENPQDMLKDIKIKVTSKGKETIISLDDKKIKLSNFDFDKLGEYSAVVSYNNKNYTFKYKVEIRKWDGSIDTSWYIETKNEFYLDNAKELAGLAELVNKGNTFENKKIHLSYDIDLNNKPWIPIGSEGIGQFIDLTKSFNGTFIGDGNTIYNLYTKASHPNKGEHLDSATSYYHFGLFGYVKNAKISDLKIQNVNITNGMGNNYKRSMQGTGALAGHTSGNVEIDNVKVLGNIVITGEYKVGGLVGSSSGESIKVSNCSVRGESGSKIYGTDEMFNDTNNFGGLIGFTATSSTNLTNVISEIDVDGFTSGGVCGNVTEGVLNLKNAIVYGTISNSEGSVVGGLIGGKFVKMNLENCYMVGRVTSKDVQYADVFVSKYGDSKEEVTIKECYFNNNKFDSEKVNNILNIPGKTESEIKNMLPKM